MPSPRPPRRPGPQRTGRGRGAVAAALVTLIALGAACEPRSDGPGEAVGPAAAGTAAAEGPPPPPVEVVRARVGALPLRERLSGVVRATNQVAIRPEIEAAVVEVLVRSGDAVKKGQPLVRLRDDVLADQLRHAEASVRLEEAAAKAARARVAEMQAQVGRSRELAAKKLVTDLELEIQEAQLAGAEAAAEQAAARVDQASATLRERRAAVEKAVIRAPIAGRVGRRNVEIGMLADPSTLLFELGNLEQMVIEIPLTGEMLAFIREGQPVRIEADSLGGAPIEATLSRISPFLAAGSFSTTGEIDVPNADGRLLPGMFVAVDVLYGESANATLVPASALWEDPRTGSWRVYAIRYDGKGAPAAAGAGDAAPPSAEAYPVEAREVRVIAEGKASVGVSGVEQNEWVVVVGQHLLSDGAPRARVRPTTWERVLDLQRRQRDGLLESFLDRQRRYARERGAEPPDNEEFMREGRPELPELEPDSDPRPPPVPPAATDG